jgi:hypothetical protein
MNSSDVLILSHPKMAFKRSQKKMAENDENLGTNAKKPCNAKTTRSIQLISFSAILNNATDNETIKNNENQQIQQATINKMTPSSNFKLAVRSVSPTALNNGSKNNTSPNLFGNWQTNEMKTLFTHRF